VQKLVGYYFRRGDRGDIGLLLVEAKYRLEVFLELSDCLDRLTRFA
jgi:hypothetical protein